MHGLANVKSKYLVEFAKNYFVIVFIIV